MTTLKKILGIGGGLLLTAGGVQCTDGTMQPSQDVIQLQVSSDSSLGTVTSDVGGLDCGSVCTVAVERNALVTLTATPVAQATFTGWGGDCSGTQATCVLTLDASKSVTANWLTAGPTITTVAPASAPNNTATLITITGSNFRAGATVTVGGQTCSNPSVVSDTQITCTVPAKAATCGPQAVVVQNPDTKNATQNAFTYRAASVAFATPVTLTGTQNGPHRMVVADFNRDGKLDLAHSNQNSNTVSVYLGGTAGTFGAATNIAVGNTPIGLVVGDVNKDNKLDLVVANLNGSSISFLAGNGMGGFAAAADTMGLSGPEGLGIGDLDGDMNPDVVVGNGGTSSVLVLKGNGLGGLTMGTPVTVGSAPKYLALVDVNKDGKLDLLVPNQGSNTVSYRPGNGNATFGAGMDIAVGTDPYEVIVADVNRDQSLDILFTSSNGNKVGVLLGNGMGAWNAAAGSPFSVGSFPIFMSVTDFNGDGRLDFVTANQGSADLSILAGNGSGGFAAVTGNPFASGNGPTGVATGDWNGDGLPDLANTNYAGSTATVRLATCN